MSNIGPTGAVPPEDSGKIDIPQDKAVAIDKGIKNLEGIKRDVQIAKMEARTGKSYAKRTRLANKLLNKIEPFITKSVAKNASSIKRYGIKVMIASGLVKALAGTNKEGKTDMARFYGMGLSAYIRKNGWDGIDRTVKKSLASRSLAVRVLAKPMYPLIKKLINETIVKNPHYQSDVMDAALNAAEVVENTQNTVANLTDKIKGALEYVLGPLKPLKNLPDEDNLDRYGIGAELSQRTQPQAEDTIKTAHFVQNIDKEELKTPLAVTKEITLDDIILEGAKAEGEKIVALIENNKPSPKEEALIKKNEKRLAQFESDVHQLKAKLVDQEKKKSQIDKSGTLAEKKKINKELLKTETDIIKSETKNVRETQETAIKLSKEASQRLDVLEAKAIQTQQERLDKTEECIRNLQKEGQITQEKAEQLLEYTDKVRPQNLMPLGKRGHVQLLQEETTEAKTKPVIVSENQAIIAVGYSEEKGNVEPEKKAELLLAEKSKGEEPTIPFHGHKINRSLAEDLDKGILSGFFELGEAPSSLWDYVPLFRHDWAATHKAQDGSDVAGTLNALKTLANGNEETLERMSHFLNKETLEALTHKQLGNLSVVKEGDKKNQWVQYNDQYLRVFNEDAQDPAYTIKVNNHEGRGGKRNVVITLQAEYAIDAFSHGLNKEDKIYNLERGPNDPEDEVPGLLTIATTIVIKEPYEVSSTIEGMLSSLAQEEISGYHIREDYDFSFMLPTASAAISQEIRSQD